MNKFFFFSFALIIKVFSDQFVFSPLVYLPSNAKNNYLYATSLEQNHQLFFSFENDQLFSNPEFIVYNPKIAKFDPALTKVEGIVDKRIVSSCYMQKNNRVLITARDIQGKPSYAIYDCLEKKIIQDLKAFNGDVDGQSSVFCTYNSNNDTVFITWYVE